MSDYRNPLNNKNTEYKKKSEGICTKKAWQITGVTIGAALLVGVVSMITQNPFTLLAQQSLQIQSMSIEIQGMKSYLVDLTTTELRKQVPKIEKDPKDVKPEAMMGLYKICDDGTYVDLTNAKTQQQCEVLSDFIDKSFDLVVQVNNK